jgi:hypothetical protein
MKKKSQKGDILVTLLFFMVISIAIITSIVFIVINTLKSGTNFEQGMLAYYAAETGIENALLRMIRNPNYSGETLTLDQGAVLIEVNGNVITSTATVTNSIRQIQVETVYNNNILEISSWKEIN